MSEVNENAIDSFPCESAREADPESNRWRADSHNRVFQYVSLLYSAFFFETPYYHPSAGRWIGFAVFYAAFLFLYFGISMVRARWRKVMLVSLFLLGFVYVPFSQSAAGIFVYAVVMYGFTLREPRVLVALRRFSTVLILQIGGMFLEASLFHLSYDVMQNVTFWMVVLGISNFAYSRQRLVSDQLRLANAEIERLAQQGERERIARDLHDLLGHTLTVIVLKSDIANRMFAIDPEMAHREIGEVEQTARKALTEVREAVVGYRAEGFVAEVTQARRALTAAGVQMTTNIEPELLTEAQVNTMCLALREAVTNVARHARATVCNLELKLEEEQVRLTVADNGAGELREEGSGLRGMRERLSALGGQMQLERVRGGGTLLTIEVPFLARSGGPVQA